MVSQVLVAVFGISLLVIVHELGHYLVARAFGMRVLRFSIGLGPVLARWQPRGSPTVFQVCAIPFLAYVMIAGMNPTDDVDPNDPDLYANKGVLARILTIFAGPFANYAAASLMVFVTALFAWREDVPTEPMVVDSIETGSPAALAGLRVGDAIVEADGRAIKNVAELIEVTKPRAGQPTVYVIERDRRRLAPITITPKDAGGRGVIGVTARIEPRYRAMPLPEAARAAVEFPYVLTVLSLEGMADLVRRRTTEGITGPVGMGKLVAEQAEKGVFEFVRILIYISVALGLFNLLPIPALDGGRLVFLGYEMVTRRRANERIEAAVHAVGLVLLLGVIALVTLRDVMG
jgi:regulator of sigma E protease